VGNSSGPRDKVPEVFRREKTLKSQIRREGRESEFGKNREEGLFGKKKKEKKKNPPSICFPLVTSTPFISKTKES